MLAHRHILSGLALLATCTAVVLPASASGEAAGATTARPERDWSVEFTPYLWAINLNMQLEGGPIDDTVGLNTTELLENISAYAMADMNVQYKRVGVMGDGMWSQLETTEIREIGLSTFETQVQAESPQVCRRLHSSRGWSDGTEEQVLPGGS